MSIGQAVEASGVSVRIICYYTHSGCASVLSFGRALEGGRQVADS